MTKWQDFPLWKKEVSGGLRMHFLTLLTWISSTVGSFARSKGVPISSMSRKVVSSCPEEVSQLVKNGVSTCPINMTQFTFQRVSILVCTPSLILYNYSILCFVLRGKKHSDLVCKERCFTLWSVVLHPHFHNCFMLFCIQQQFVWISRGKFENTIRKSKAFNVRDFFNFLHNNIYVCWSLFTSTCMLNWM